MACAILDAKMICRHNSGLPPRIFLTFCSKKKFKKYIKIILTVFLKKFSFWANGQFRGSNMMRLYNSSNFIHSMVFFYSFLKWQCPRGTVKLGQWFFKKNLATSKRGHFGRCLNSGSGLYTRKDGKRHMKIILIAFS